MILALAIIPEMLFALIVNPIVLPVLSDIQDQKNRLKNYLLQMTRLLYLFGVPMVLCLVIFSRSVLSVVYPDNYSQVHWAYYLAIGRPELHRKFTFLRVVLMVIAIYPAVLWWNTTGAAGARLFCLLLAGMWQLITLKKLLDISLKMYLNTAKEGIYLALMIIIPALAWRYWINSEWAHLIGGMMLCTLAWLTGFWKFRDKIKQKIFGYKEPVLANQ